MLLKLDLEKAFDKLEWSFIHYSLSSLNFPPTFINLLCFALQLVIFQYWLMEILLNISNPHGELDKEIHCHLIYLFIIFLEMFSRRINTSVDYRNWSPVSLGQQGPQLSHLCFADDIILTSKITAKSCQAMVTTLTQFTNHSSQIINFDKSKILFCKNCSSNIRNTILQWFHITEGKTFWNYLGFSIFSSQPTKMDYQFLIENFKNKLAEWKIIFLTKTGRTTLIRSTLNSFPNHIMQYIKLPYNIITSLSRPQPRSRWRPTNC